MFFVTCQTLFDETISLLCMGSENTIRYLKEQLASKLHLHPKDIQLVHRQTVLQDYNTLAHYNIGPDVTLQLVGTCRTGR
jgi:hypothetical protein